MSRAPGQAQRSQRTHQTRAQVELQLLRARFVASTIQLQQIQLQRAQIKLAYQARINRFLIAKFQANLQNVRATPKTEG